MPDSAASVGELARYLAANDPEWLDEPPAWNHERLALKVREIICSVLGCQDTYHEDSRLVEDLGLK